VNILSVFGELLAQSGFAALTWQQAVMLLISFILLYLAIKKQFEPLLLLPIAFGMFLANLPLAGLMNEADNWYNSGVLRIIYSGVKSSLFPCLIFMAVGAMTDFGPLIAKPFTWRSRPVRHLRGFPSCHGNRTVHTGTGCRHRYHWRC